MIEINTRLLSVFCVDKKCKDQEEIFPPYRTEETQEGTTLFGADGKSFFINKGRSSYLLDGVEKDYPDFLNDLNSALSVIQNPPVTPEGQQIEKSPLPPSDNSKIWQNSENELFFWDGANWVSVVESSILATESGSTATNIFMKVGDVRTTPIRGWTAANNVKITRATWTNTTGAAVSFNLFESGSLIGQVVTGAAARGQSPTTPAGLTIGADQFLSIQYAGAPTNSNVFFEVFYRKIGA